MNLSPISKKTLFLSFLFSTVIVIVLFCIRFFDKRTLVVFCDVGQGDGAYLRLNNKTDIVIDAGPSNNMMLQCIGKHMPFYDRTIEYVILSHPQLDHYGGLLEIAKRYEIRSLFSLPISDNSKTLAAFKGLLKDRHIPVITPYAFDVIEIGNEKILFLSPRLSNVVSLEQGKNDFSLVAEIRGSTWRIFFTGDVSSRIMNKLPIIHERTKTIVKIPHHGSKYGLSRIFFRLAEPTEAVISVGKNNSYGHPAKKVLDYLEASKIKIRRTDKEGDIVYKF